MDDIVLYNAKDIQRIFQCGRTKAYQIMNMRGFPSFRVGSMVLVEKTALEKWIAKLKNQ